MKMTLLFFSFLKTVLVACSGKKRNHQVGTNVERHGLLFDTPPSHTHSGDWPICVGDKNGGTVIGKQRSGSCFVVVLCARTDVDELRRLFAHDVRPVPGKLIKASRCVVSDRDGRYVSRPVDPVIGVFVRERQLEAFLPEGKDG